MHARGSKRNARESKVVERDEMHALAARQHGVVTTAQLRALEVGPRAIAHRVATGRLHALHRGVYLVGPLMGPRTPAAAALLACGPEAALSNRWAAADWGLPCDPGALVDIAVASGQPRSRPGIRVRRATLAPADVTIREGLRITTPARTLLDLAAEVDAARLERLVEEAQVLRLTTRRALEDQLRAPMGAAVCARCERRSGRTPSRP